MVYSSGNIFPAKQRYPSQSVLSIKPYKNIQPLPNNALHNSNALLFKPVKYGFGSLNRFIIVLLNNSIKNQSDNSRRKIVDYFVITNFIQNYIMIKNN